MLYLLFVGFALLGSASRVSGITYNFTDFGLSDDDWNLIHSLYEDEDSGTTMETPLVEETTPEVNENGSGSEVDLESHGAEEEDEDSHGTEEEDEESHDDHEGHDHGEGEHEETDFEIILETLGSEKMDKDTFSNLLKSLFTNFRCDEVAAVDCSQCANPDRFFDAVGLSGEDAVMAEEDFEKASFILAYYMANGFQLLCNESRTFAKLPIAKNDIFPYGNICPSVLKRLVGRFKGSGCPEVRTCYTESSLSSDPSYCVSSLDEAGPSMMKMIKSIYTCKCNLPKQEAFLSDVLGFMQAKDNIAPVEGFVKLLDELGLGKDGAVAEDDHSDHDDHSGHNHRRRRAVGADDSGIDKCYSGTELANIFGVKTNVGLTKENFIDICPALIQQLYSKSCIVKKDEATSNATNGLANYTTDKKYGYATVSVFLISLLAFIGLLVFPSIGTPGYKLTMQFFIALGVGSLSGDALLHIIPEILEIHKHEVGVIHDHAEEVDRTYLWRLVVVVCGIYFFFLFENSIRLWNKLSKTKISLHVHENGNDGVGHNGGRRLSHYITEIPVMTSDGNTNELKTIQPQVPVVPPTPPATLNKGESLNNHGHNHSHGKKEKEIVCCGLTTVALMVMIGDILHNFGDGLAIGVAFSSSWMGGIGTSIAIFCHELPHEFGDFAIYLNNGLGKWKALGLNFVAACFAFVGCYIGLAAASDEGARSWMMAVIAGMFLYIALVDVLHEMLEEECDRPILQFILQNVGLIFGWILLLLIGYYEESLLAIAV